jgi:outer membrane protein OmpA-like peptidoglycan-associated protein
MNEYPKMEILLEGHSDNQGDLMENIKLSQARVDNVSRFLVVKGINSGRIKTKAWGGSKPISSNTTEETRKKNRRVEFTITKI